MDEERSKLRAETAAARETTHNAAAQLAEQEAAIAVAREQLTGYAKQKASLLKERQEALQGKASAEADVEEAQAALEAGGCKDIRCCYKLRHMLTTTDPARKPAAEQCLWLA